MDSNEVYYDLGEGMSQFSGTTEQLFGEEFYDDYSDASTTLAPPLEDTTDPYNRTSPIYSITPDFLYKW